MGRKTVHVSDFSGKVLQSDDEVVRVVVLEHPDLVAGPVQLEARSVEVESIDDASLDVAVVEIYDSHGGGEPRRVVLTASEFDALATDVPMAQLLKTAERIKPARAAKKTAADRLDYATLEHAGKPHRGKTTEEEAQLVREHLDEINKRLADEGIRQIDPADPEHATRYGFPV
ncbi:hypothetical protein [Micromonospora sp. NBC_01796]|uniref:hypothetical protein n=1 Tax=Micromonospora sp. NBC_01796 TaxID=2975987 RepID=UPI002DD8D2EA|nr:hypothetical protein [Micromonospora sp. NBC_01796]WSA82768.1 hypothetical protein OIE47_20150 [Micromonospora sp. NBC_01796]